MRPALVVRREPVIGEALDLPHDVEDVGVEDFFAVRAIEAFDEGILIGLPRLDVADDKMAGPDSRATGM